VNKTQNQERTDVRYDLNED